MAQTEHEKELTRLEGELKQLEVEYNMFFAGRLPKPDEHPRCDYRASENLAAKPTLSVKPVPPFDRSNCPGQRDRNNTVVVGEDARH